MSNLDQLQKLILASSSPRRAEILRAVGWPFETRVAGIDETVETGEDPINYVKRLALGKATEVARNFTKATVLGADTTVVVDGEILGQPDDDEDAKRMLCSLSGKWHEVLTGVALISIENRKSVVSHEKTRVRFAKMSSREIDWYVATGEPTGKAGAYGVQGKAALFIKEIEGDYFNIVGLPVRLVYELMTELLASHSF